MKKESASVSKCSGNKCRSGSNGSNGRTLKVIYSGNDPRVCEMLQKALADVFDDNKKRGK